MPKANVLLANDFDGLGYPVFQEWPSFDWPTGNPPYESKPVVNGKGQGIPSRSVAALWRGRDQRNPGRADYKADLTCSWSNAGGAGDREVGLVVRFKDFSNCLVARLRSMGPGSPELRLFKVQAGTSTQLGSTYTGSPISATNLNAGVTWRVRVADLTDGSGQTSVKVYVEPEGLTGNGTLVIDWTGDLSYLRGPHGVGVELGALCSWADVRLDRLAVYDFADEWLPAAPSPAPGTGWQVELGGTLYDIDDSSGGLQALDPPITLLSVSRKYGLSGANEAKLRVEGDAFTSILRVNQRVRIWHDGALRHDGYLAGAEHSATPGESQTWVSKSVLWQATEILVESDSGDPTLYFNLDEEDENYDPAYADYSVGDILAFVFDRYQSTMQAKGCAPPMGKPYVVEELQALDAVLPSLTVSGNLLAAVQGLVGTWYPSYQVLFDPNTKRWHFVDITNLTGENVELTNVHALLSFSANPDAAYTAVLFRGTRREQGDPIVLTMADRAWTSAQEQNHEKDKRHKTRVTLTALAAGRASDVPGAPTGALVYVDVAAGQLHEDDWRGAIAIGGDDFERFVVKNTSTRIWLGSPLWAGDVVPSLPFSLILNTISEKAAALLSAQGVGRAFFLPPSAVCGASGILAGHLNQGWCGTARVSTKGDDGATYTQEYAYKVHISSVEASNAGFCQPVVALSEVVKPPVGLVNKLPPAGGSPPKVECETRGQSSRFPQVEVELRVPTVEDNNPRKRVPDVGWYGPAFSADQDQWGVAAGEPAGDDWGIRREFPINLSTYTDPDAQDADLAKAGQAILNLVSQKPYTFAITLATPWRTHFSAGPRPPSATSTWADLDKRVTISSTLRTTGWEATDQLPVFAVEWKVPEGQTVLTAGTASGWVGADYGAIAKLFLERDGKLQAARMLKTLEDFRNRLLDKSEDRVGGMQAGAVSGCDVTVIDHNTRRVTTVQTKMEDEQEAANHGALLGLANELINQGTEKHFPGAPVDVPGLSGPEAQQVGDGRAGPLLGPLVSHRIPFQGPPDLPNGDRSKYGGLIGQDEEEAGDSPQVLFRFGGYAIAKKPNAAGTGGGAVALLLAPLDEHGEPGTWQDFGSSLDFPEGRAPLGALNHYSIQHQLLLRTQELARGLGRVESSLGDILAPGDAAGSITEAPADLASMLRAPGVLGDLRVVPSSFGDPGGVVLEGPLSSSGASSGLFWRVMTPEMLLVRVEPTAAGSGTNGGSWSWWAGGPGGTMEYLSSGRVVHKQAHPVEFEAVCGLDAVPAPATEESSHPFGISGHALALDGAAESGVAVNIPVPDGARGEPAFQVQLKEDWSNPLSAGQKYNLTLRWSYQASAWSSPGSSTITGALTGDGSGTGTGQFTAAGGQVPPGLRAISVAVQNPGTGTGGFGGIVTGIGVDLAVVEGGYLLRVKEAPVEVADAWTHNHPWGHDVAAADDDWALTFTKATTDAANVFESWSVELNPPAPEVDEGLVLSDSCSVKDSWAVELNPS